MKKILIPLICFLTVAGMQAQTKTTTYYYKNSKFKKVVPEKKANYKVVRYTKKDTVVFKSYKIQGNQLLTVLKTLNGRPAGIWYKYNETGLLIYREDFRPLVYSNAPVKNMIHFKKSDPRIKFYKNAHFPGGNHALMYFITSHLHYPVMAEDMNNEGLVHIRFIVEKDGTAVPYSISKGAGPFLDLAAWNVIKELPKWTPAQFKGKPVRQLFVLPIKYKYHPKGVELPYNEGPTISSRTSRFHR